jgi:hypothetical protein
MRDDHNPRGEKLSNEQAEEALFLEDLHRDMATCVFLDPGPDPTWDPGEWPEEDEEDSREEDES